MDPRNTRLQPEGIAIGSKLYGGIEMYRRFPILVAFSILLAPQWIVAQENRFELDGLVGYTFSEGVDTEAKEEGDRIGPERSFSYGLGVDYYFTENLAAGFNFGQQASTLRTRLGDYEGLDVTDMKVNNFHVLLTYNFFEEDEILRPFIFGGIGATNYSPAGIGQHSIEGTTRFSTTWGGGVKYYTSEHLGFRGGLRWTPTRINSESSGIFCSSYWDCWILDKSNFSHQFEFNVGIVARF